MAQFSSALTLRRLANRQVQVTHQLITFVLRQEWFALPIYAVQKVVPMGKVHGDLRGSGVSLTFYQGQEIIVVDLAMHIFGEMSSNEQLQKDTSPQGYLIVAQNSQGQLFGVPIDSPPVLRRVPESAFVPLPQAYLSAINLKGMSSMMIQDKDDISLFLLNPDQLLES